MAPVAAQDPVAEVRTWSGETLRLSQPSLEVFYTILVKGKEDAPPPPTPAPAAPQMLFGSATALAGGGQKAGSPVRAAPGRDGDPPEGWGGAAHSPPEPGESRLRPSAGRQLASAYLAVTHFRYAATAVLVDGTTVEGDYVNLGTTILRGTTADGRVEVPWHEIETLRFVR